MEIIYSDNIKYFMNIPSENRKSKDLKNKHNSILEFSENTLETLIVNNPTIRDGLINLLGIDSINNQLPVGIFKEKISNTTKIFTGSKSAIDIWATKRNCFYIFELKKNENKPLGILSEMFFYSFVIYDLLTEKFLYGGEETPFNPYNFNSIKSFFLVFQLHPLIDKKLIQMINTAYKIKNIPIEFGQIIISGDKIENLKFTYAS
ncbi:MAG: hypothetical protein ACTSX0_02005 [Promethearchaeota archaeon]